MNFPSQVFFNDINHGYRAVILKKSSLWLLPSYMDVATYCYYEKVRRTMRTTIVYYLLKPCLYVVQSYQGKKWTVIKMLFVYLSHREKINQLKGL